MNNQLFNLDNYQLSGTGIIYLIASLTLMALGLLNLYRTQNSYHSKTLFFLATSISIWLFFSSLNFFSLHADLAFFWSNASFIGVPLIAPANYLFTISILYPAKNVNRKSIGFLLLGIAFVIAQVHFHFMFDTVYQYSWGFYSKFKPDHIMVFSLFYNTIIGYCLYELIQSYRRSAKWTALKRKRLKLLIIAFITGNLGAVNFLPGMGVNIYPIGIFFILMFIVVLVYAIEKYQLIELNLFVANKIINSIHDALIVCDSEGAIYYFNRATNNLSRYAKIELEDKCIDDLFLITQASHEQKKPIEILSGQQHEVKLEGSLKAKDGSMFPVSLSCSPILGQNQVIKGWILIAHDIRDYIESIDQLSHLSNHDYLTGIFNRKRFEEALDYEINVTRRNNSTSALIILDIDHFKEINDSFGHKVGDELLIRFSRFLQNVVRNVDVVGRIGGDEFAIIFTNIDPHQVDAIAKKLQSQISSAHFKIANQTFSITSSMGIVLIPDNGQDRETLIVNADLSLYYCKLENRNSYKIYKESYNWNQLFKDNLVVVNMLKDAIDNDKLVLFGQPIKDLKTGIFSHYELLIRIADGDEYIGPSEFLTVAERYGFMNQINLFVVKTAMAFIRANPDTQFSINISANAFYNQTLIQEIKEKIRQAYFNPAQLIIEITENIVVTHIKLVHEFIEDCRALGIRFALDDFGVGLSSFNYLKYLNFDYIKIDGSFITNICHDHTDKQFVRSMVDISKALGIKVIAEFVENVETEMLLNSLNVDYAQGYLYSKPHLIPLNGTIQSNINPLRA